MPAWLVIIVTILFWAIWPTIVIVLHVSEEKRIKKERTDKEKKADDFLNNIKKGQ